MRALIWQTVRLRFTVACLVGCIVSPVLASADCLLNVSDRRIVNNINFITEFGPVPRGFQENIVIIYPSPYKNPAFFIDAPDQFVSCNFKIEAANPFCRGNKYVNRMSLVQIGEFKILGNFAIEYSHTGMSYSAPGWCVSSVFKGRAGLEANQIADCRHSCEEDASHGDVCALCNGKLSFRDINPLTHISGLLNAPAPRLYPEADRRRGQYESENSKPQCVKCDRIARCPLPKSFATTLFWICGIGIVIGLGLFYGIIWLIGWL